MIIAMTKNNLIDLIKENLLEIVPELSERPLNPDDNFVMLGLNSVDRGELISLTLEKLELAIPRIEFVSAQTINELADVVIDKRQA